MAVEMSDAEYAGMLAGGNTTIFFHSMPRKPKEGDFERGVADAIYRAVRQVFKDRLGIELPEQRPPRFGSRLEEMQHAGGDYTANR